MCFAMIAVVLHSLHVCILLCISRILLQEKEDEKKGGLIFFSRHQTGSVRRQFKFYNLDFIKRRALLEIFLFTL